MNSNDTSCRLLVRKLNFDSTEEELKEFYGKWGSVEDCKIVKHKDTGKSKGYGFIRYVKPSMVDDAMAARPHVLGGRTLEPHRSAPKEYSDRWESHHTCNEIHCGKHVEELTEDDYKEYFGQYGTVEKVSIPQDKETEKSRGFAIVTFDDYDPVDVTCYKKVHHLKEKRIFVSKFIPKKEMNDLRRKYGKDEGGFQGGARGGQIGNIDTSALQSLLLQKVLEMNYQSSGNDGPMRGNKFGGNRKPYGKRGGRN